MSYIKTAYAIINKETGQFFSSFEEAQSVIRWSDESNTIYQNKSALLSLFTRLEQKKLQLLKTKEVSKNLNMRHTSVGKSNRDISDEFIATINKLQIVPVSIQVFKDEFDAAVTADTEYVRKLVHFEIQLKEVCGTFSTSMGQQSYQRLWAILNGLIQEDNTILESYAILDFMNEKKETFLETLDKTNIPYTIIESKNGSNFCLIKDIESFLMLKLVLSNSRISYIVIPDAVSLKDKVIAETSL